MINTDQNISKTHLLLAAQHLFSHTGYGSTTTRAIAELAGCNIALITYYFGGKEGLYDAVLDDWVDRLRVRIEYAVSEAATGRERTEALVEAFLRYAIIEAGGFASVVARESILAAPSPATERTAAALRPVIEIFDTLLPACESTITDGAECLGFLLRLAAPLPSVAPGADPQDWYRRAKQHARAILLSSALYVPHASLSAPQTAPAFAETPDRAVHIQSPVLDFID